MPVTGGVLLAAMASDVAGLGEGVDKSPLVARKGFTFWVGMIEPSFGGFLALASSRS